MSDADIFARFIYEMRTLLTAIESHVTSLGGAAPEERRPHALSEIARLAHAAAELAQVFAVDDLRTLADALALSATDAGATDAPLPPLGARDTLSYMKWRLERLSTSGFAAQTSERDLAILRRLEQMLRPATPAQLPAHDDAAAAQASADAAALTPEEQALVQSFASASLRPRDERLDAQLIARVTGSPAFMAQTHSGGAIPVFGGDPDDLDVVPIEMKRMFISETQANLRELGQLMLDFEQRPEEGKAISGMAFIAHTLKGSAATMGFNGLAAIAVSFQDTLKTSRTNEPVFLATLGRFLEIFERALEAAALLEEPAPALIEAARRLRDALIQPNAAPESQPGHQPPQAPGAEYVTERAHAEEYTLVLHIEASRLDMLMNKLSALAANRGAVSRNRSEIAHAQSEMEATLARLRETSAQLTDSHPLTYENLVSLAQMNGQASRAVMPGAVSGALPTPATPSGALRASWSSLQREQYTEIDTALRSLSEVVADTATNYSILAALLTRLGQLTESQETLTREIQKDAMDIRMARFVEIIPRLRLSAIVAADNLGKQIEFAAHCDGVEIDRSLLETLEEPLIQLVRNAVAHGVESPDERLEAGKPANGRVWVHAFNAGNEIIIEVCDDGRGINPNLLLGAAIGAQLITPDAARQLTAEQALNMMFESGISTSGATASGYAGALAGTGIGLTNVADTIHALKGTITVHNDLGKGTCFEIHVPISLSITHIIEVHAGGQTFALPFALIDATGIIAPERLREQPAPVASGHLREWRLTVDAPPTEDELAGVFATPAPEGAAADPLERPARLQSEIPAYALAEILGFEQDVAALHHMVIIQLRGEAMALLVESVGEGEVREATVRALPRRVRRRVARGVVVRPEDGEVALLVDPQEALAQRLVGAAVKLRPASSHTGPRAPSPAVLIVDDSVTIRRTIEQTLTAAGFKTYQAHDGYEALEMIENDLPRVIILDIEMPRLSGIELLTIIRSSPQYRQTRVVMLTSRGANKHREYALAIGADAYLVKPCPQDDLVETIRRLLRDSEPE